MKAAECDLKRMGDSVGKPFTIGDDSGGRILPVYSIGDTTYQSSNITQMGENIIYKMSEDATG